MKTINYCALLFSACLAAAGHSQYYEDANNDGYLDYIDEGGADGTYFTYYETGSDSYTFDFDSRVGFNYRVQESNNGSSWWNLSSLFSGQNNWIEECFFNQYSVPHTARLIEYGKPSSLIGPISSVSIFGGLGLEKIQKVTQAIKNITGGIVEIELKLPSSSPVTGGTTAIAWPAGASPSIANIKILGVGVGVTLGGKMTVEADSNLIPGAPGDYDFGIVLTEEPPVKVEYLNSSGSVVYSLKVGKWEGAIDGFGIVKALYIDNDPDHFVLRVKDISKKGAGEVYAAFSTALSTPNTYDDTPNKVRLVETPSDSAIFLSQPLLLNSDTEDDGHHGKSKFLNANGVEVNQHVADNADYDRNHIIKLNGIAYTRYPETGDLIKDAAAITPAIKSVSVTVIRFANTSTLMNTIQDRWNIVSERMAQVGIKVNVTFSDNVAPAHSGIDFADGFVPVTDPPGPNNLELTSEAELIVDCHGSFNVTSDIHVFYVEDMEDENGTGARGAAMRFSTLSSTGYANNIFIDGADNTIFTAAHEIGHLLLDDGHTNTSTNLMHTTTDSSNNKKGKKRLTAAQHSRIHTNPSGILQNP